MHDPRICVNSKPCFDCEYPSENLVIQMSQSDLEDLLNGEEFNWSFTTNKGRSIDVLIRPENDYDNE